MAPTWTGKEGKPAKMGEHFPDRKSQGKKQGNYEILILENWEHSRKVRNICRSDFKQNIGKVLEIVQSEKVGTRLISC